MILPIHNDIKIYPLSTTDQINNIESIGVTNYFKPYKRTRKAISGDFFISTKLLFDDLKNHQAFQTWLYHHGYSIIKNSCQTADVVRVGFLMQVRGVMYHNDLQDFITSMVPYMTAPFHLRLSYDTLTCKGKIVYVLMIDVDCPNVDQAINFFQEWFDGDKPTSPNEIPYLFLPLFKKSYTNEE